jgi:hypothetical protein
LASRAARATYASADPDHPRKPSSTRTYLAGGFAYEYNLQKSGKSSPNLLYSEFLFGEVPKVEPWVEKANEIDFYIYLSPDAPYFDDGTRMKKSKRDELDKSHHKLLDKKCIHEFAWNSGGYKEFSNEQKYEERFKNVVYHLNQFIYKFQ